MKKSIFIICMLASGCTAMAEQVEKPGPAIETQTLVPLTERVNVQADSACVNQIIDGCWVAVGAKKAHAIQRDFNLMFNGKPSYRFELKEKDVRNFLIVMQLPMISKANQPIHIRKHK